MRSPRFVAGLCLSFVEYRTFIFQPIPVLAAIQPIERHACRGLVGFLAPSVLES